MFESARSKINRAEVHVSELKRQFEVFLAHKPYRFEVAVHPETRQPSVDLVTTALPLGMAEVIGDALHCIRAALDRAAWEAVGLDGGAQDHRLQFPVGDDRDRFHKACSKIRTGSEKLANAFRSFEAYPDGKGTALFVLHGLDILDKHRDVLPTLGVAKNRGQLRVLRADGTILATFDGGAFRVIPGSRLSVFESRDIDRLELNEVPEMAPSIFFKQVSDVDVFGALSLMRAEAGLVVDRLEAIATSQHS